jgi:acetyltransferase-like isoleucine patch superfamily enzyme
MIKLLAKTLQIFYKVFDKYVKSNLQKKLLGSCGKNVVFRYNKFSNSLNNVYLEDYTQLVDFTFISNGGKLYIKKYSGAPQGFTVVTNTHIREVGRNIREVMDSEDSILHEKDVIIEEDVTFGTNVTVLAGVTIGRGASIGAGSVIRTSIPPYAIVTGNPAKIVGFNYTPEDIVEHEKALYQEEERLTLDFLEKNYNKYFLKRLKEIKEFTRL